MRRLVSDRFHPDTRGRVPLLKVWAAHIATLDQHMVAPSRKQFAEALTAAGHVVGRYKNKIFLAGFSEKPPKRYSVDPNGCLKLA